MKLFILLFFTLLSLVVLAQAPTDSTEIKLSHYKELFIKGLITAQEYEQLKQQALGINASTPQAQNVVIVKPESRYKLPDSLTIEKYHNNYRGNIIVGGVALPVGAVILIVDGVESPNLKVAGTVLTAIIGATCTVVGIVALSKGISQRRVWRRASGEAYLKIKPTGIGFAYNF